MCCGTLPGLTRRSPARKAAIGVVEVGHLVPLHGLEALDHQLRDAVAATQLATVVGPVKWGGQGPFRNVSKTPLVLGQWVKGT